MGSRGFGVCGGLAEDPIWHEGPAEQAQAAGTAESVLLLPITPGLGLWRLSLSLLCLVNEG